MKWRVSMLAERRNDPSDNISEKCVVEELENHSHNECGKNRRTYDKTKAIDDAVAQTVGKGHLPLDACIQSLEVCDDVRALLLSAFRHRLMLAHESAAPWAALSKVALFC